MALGNVKELLRRVERIEAQMAPPDAPGIVIVLSTATGQDHRFIDVTEGDPSPDQRAAHEAALAMAEMPTPAPQDSHATPRSAPDPGYPTAEPHCPAVAPRTATQTQADLLALVRSAPCR